MKKGGFKPMLHTANDAGMKRDQLEGFLKRHVILQPKQMVASVAARDADINGNPHLIGYGGARSGGKSHWLIAQLAVDDCQRFPGLKCLLLRKSGKAIKEQIKDLRKILKKTPHKYIESQGMGTIRFPNGSFIVLGHFKDDRDIDGYLGLEYDVIGIEEATTLSKTKVDDILTCLRSSKKGWRPRAYFTTNPGGIGHQWFKKLFIAPYRLGEAAELKAGTRFIPATVDDNKKVNKEYKSSLTRLTGWKKLAWLDGDWDVCQGQFFSLWRQDDHVWNIHKTLENGSELGDIPIGDRRCWLAMDYGFQHWQIVYLLCEDGDGNVYFVDEHAGRGMLPEQHDKAIRAMLARHGVEQWQLADFKAGTDLWSTESDGGKKVAKYEELGWDLTGAETDRIDGAAEWLIRLGDPENGIPQRVWISSRCARLIECLPALQHDPTCPERTKKWDCSEDGEGGDDPYDAGRYGIMNASSQAGQAWNF